MKLYQHLDKVFAATATEQLKAISKYGRQVWAGWRKLLRRGTNPICIDVQQGKAGKRLLRLDVVYTNLGVHEAKRQLRELCTRETRPDPKISQCMGNKFLVLCM